MQPLPLKLAPGSDLRLSLEELAQRDGISGFVLGVVGNLTKAVPVPRPGGAHRAGGRS